jgi:hypothetical protein
MRPTDRNMILLIADAGGIVKPPISNTGMLIHRIQVDLGRSFVATQTGSGARAPARKNQLRLLYKPSWPKVLSGPTRPQITEDV